jgi:NAD(P)-dependent dehydrogenase (short-subunit alcohol dehydrogenase family)
MMARVVVVTGGASGIGRAMVRRFVDGGDRVLAVDLDDGRLRKVIAEIGSDDVQPWVGDVATAAGAAAMIEAAVGRWGRLDVLCNNAGVLDNLTPLHETDDATWRRVMGVNVDGPFFACRAALPHMLAAGRGCIVNTASAAGEHGGRGGASYTASKHAVVGLTRNIAWYYGPKGVRCNAIAPGSVLTKMQSMVPHNDGFARTAPYIPLIPPAGRAAEVAEAAVFLASDAASYVNGSILAVDGGWTAY